MTRRTDQWLRLSDGRRLGFAEYGDPLGRPLLLFHDTPGSRLKRHPDDRIAEALGARIIALDRPGYGLSDPQPQRRLLDWPDDVAQFADRLRLARFAVMGISGGGPYAAACAYAMPDRVRQAGIVSGAGMLDAPGATAGMLLVNRLGLQAARHLPPTVLTHITRMLYATVQRIPARLFAGVAAGLPAADRAVLADPATFANSVLSIREGLRRSTAGLSSDMAILARPWGFRLEAIRVPVALWHGTADKNVPVALAQVVARAIPHCWATFYPGAGHLLMYSHWRTIVAALVASEVEGGKVASSK